MNTAIKTLAFYGHTSTEFDTAFPPSKDFLLHEMQDLYQVLLCSIINDHIEIGYTRFATTSKEGVNLWLAQYILAQKKECISRPPTLTMIAPRNLDATVMSKRDYERADHIIHANSNDEYALCDQLVAISDRVLLFSFSPDSEYILKAAVAHGVKVSVHTPYTLLSTYMHIKKKP